ALIGRPPPVPRPRRRATTYCGTDSPTGALTRMRSRRPYAAGVASPRPETVTVLFTDVVGSTAFRTRVGDARADVRLFELERVSRDVVAGHGGEVVKGLGDGVMATFASAVAALDAAVALQILVDRFYRAAGLQLRFGLSSGDMVREAMDWHGPAAIEASRLCAEA